MMKWIDDEDQLVDDGDGEYEYDDRDGAPEPIQREPSSPWLDEDAKNLAAKRGSLRRAGRPTRKPDTGGPAQEHGTGTYRTGKVPQRGESSHGQPTDEGTRTGLRTGRRPKRET
jgi:hypothetical protein